MKRALRTRALWLGLLAVSAMPGTASASIHPGLCQLRLTFTFNSDLRSASQVLSSPGYSLSVSGVDMTTAVGGSQHCATPSGGAANPWSTTNVTATPLTVDDTWTCEAMLGSGTWTQSFSGPPPQVTDGSYSVTGTWGSWVMTITNISMPTFVSTIDLTFGNPLDALDYKACLDGDISSLTLIGVQQFIDP